MTLSARPIVVGVDESRESLRAAAMAWSIAEAGGRPCHAVYAMPDSLPAPLIPDLWRGTRSGFRTIDTRARARVQHALRTVLPSKIAQGLETRTGRAPIVIADAARRHRAALVVVGSARDSRGRTAQYLLRRGSWSVLVVRSAPPIRRILAAVDGSEASQAAVRAGEEYARVLGASLQAVHVMDLSKDPTTRHQGRLERSQEALSRFLSRHGGVKGSVRRAATASAGIIGAAAKWRAELVIVAARRRGRIDRLLLGSATERLLTDLPTSLLVVRAPRR
jgi:nucleotide-binding universal stress UspA family protein